MSKYRGDEPPGSSGSDQNAPLRQDFFPKPEMGGRLRILTDGRSAVVENWHSPENHLDCRTVWYATEGTEGWTEEAHYSYLEENGLLRGKRHPSRSAGVLKMLDEAGREVWSVTVVMREVVRDS